MIYPKTCVNPECQKAFEAKRDSARFCSDACRAVEWKANGGEAGGERVLPHALDEVRCRAEESDEKARWTLIVREHIARTLNNTGYFSAADLDSLGVPEQHVNVCTSQIGSFASARLMKKLSWRRSEKASRKGGILWTFQVTDRGRKKLPGLLTDLRSDIHTLVGSNSGSSGGTGVVTVRSGENPGVGSPAITKSGEASSSPPVAADPDSPESLFEQESECSVYSTVVEEAA